MLRVLGGHRASVDARLSRRPGVSSSCWRSPRARRDEVPYEDEIAAWHAEKDRFMRESPDSPVLAAERATFPPLPYFPIDAEYRVPASLTVARGR